MSKQQPWAVFKAKTALSGKTIRSVATEVPCSTYAIRLAVTTGRCPKVRVRLKELQLLR